MTTADTNKLYNIGSELVTFTSWMFIQVDLNWSYSYILLNDFLYMFHVS